MFPYRVGIFGLKSWTGGMIYVQNLVRALAILPPDERPHMTLACEADFTGFETLQPLVDALITYQPRFRQASGKQPAQVLWRRWMGVTRRESHVERANALRQAQVAVSFPISELLHSVTPNPIQWIADFQHCWLPQLFDRKVRLLINMALWLRLHTTGDIVVSSEHARADALRFFGTPRARLHVLRFATVPQSSWYGDWRPVQLKYGLPENYLIISNQFWAHKDHKTVFEAVRLLKSQGERVVVVCTGPTVDYRDPTFFPRIKARPAELGIDDQVRILGLIPREDQMLLMRGASAVVQPSLFEGWNTALEEARALGKPVIASDFPVHIEQDLPGALYFRRGDPVDCAKAIHTHFARYGSEVVSYSDETAQLANVTAYARRFMEIVACVVEHTKD